MNAREWAWTVPNLSPAERSALVALTESYNPWSGWCREGLKELAERTGYHPEHLRKILRGLETKRVIRRGSDRNYALPLPKRTRKGAGRSVETSKMLNHQQNAEAKEQVSEEKSASYAHNRDTFGISKAIATPTFEGSAAIAGDELTHNASSTSGTPPHWLKKPQRGGQIDEWLERRAAGVPLPAHAEGILARLEEESNGSGSQA